MAWSPLASHNEIHRRRRKGSLLWAFLLLSVLIVVYYAQEPALSAYRHSDWGRFRPYFVPDRPPQQPADPVVNPIHDLDSHVDSPVDAGVKVDLQPPPDAFQSASIDSTATPSSSSSSSSTVRQDGLAATPSPKQTYSSDTLRPNPTTMLADLPPTSRPPATYIISSQVANPLPTGPPVPDDVPIDHSNPRLRLAKWLQDIIDWDPPAWAWMHVPYYGGYYDRDYDPNRFEAFDKNVEFFEENTVARRATSEAYRPYPDYNSPRWRARWKGGYVPCEGFHGLPFNESDQDVVRVYNRTNIGQWGNPAVGSFEAVGLNGNVCFDRYSRLGPFGAAIEGNIDWFDVKLGALQDACLQRNADRYDRSDASDLRPPKEIPAGNTTPFSHNSTSQTPYPTGELTFQPRTAILVRSWESYEYEENDIHALRSLVSELSLQSGSEYAVFLFVMLEDWADVSNHELLDKKLERVPEEFRDMTIFWSEGLSKELYPKAAEHVVNKAQFMSVQWFMGTHPEFEYVWNWEMDARLIGQHYEFLEQVVNFAREQPRKYLWERNARYYIPEMHGSYKQFFDDTNAQIAASPFVSPVWGETYHDKVEPLALRPPRTMDQDKFEWGVGEEADFISLLPIWDPRFTTWGWKRSIWGYSDDATDIPRRAYINTHARYSRRLLQAMHLENQQGRLMASEVWPSTVALHHGMKAVHAPQPIWTTHKWPGMYADAVFNADGWGAGSFHNASETPDDGVNEDHSHPEWGRGVAYNETQARLQLPQTGTGPNGEGAMARWSQERDSVYNADREHNFAGWSWYFRSDGAALIYWRWLGWKQTFSVLTMGWQSDYDEFPDIGTDKWEKTYGRLCMPSMMLHPVKRVRRMTDEDKEQEKKLEEDRKEMQEAKEKEDKERDVHLVSRALRSEWRHLRAH